MPKRKRWKFPDTGRGIVDQCLLWRLLKIRCRTANRGLLAAGARGLVDRCGNLIGGNECKAYCYGNRQFIVKHAALK